MIAPYLLAGLLFSQAPAAPPVTSQATQDMPSANVMEMKESTDMVVGGQPRALDEADALLIENYILRLQALQAEMDRRRQAIEARIGAKYPGYAVDWKSGALLPVTPPATEPEP